MKKLDLSENVLESLPPSFAHMISPEVINLSKNALKKLPVASTENPKSRFGRDLKTLNLNDNQLESIDEWLNESNRFVCLEKLDISNNQISELQNKSMSNMINLRDLNCSKNNISTLPDSLCETLRLKILDVSDNKLESLPELLGSQQLLEEINCSNNQLTELPKDLRKKFNIIKKFNFSKNYIKFVDKSLHHLQQLQELDLNNNQISKIQLPASRDLTKLKLGENPNLETEKLVSRLPSSTFSSQLTCLDLSNCGLKEFPVEISKLLALDDLNLSSNNLGPECPVGIGKLRNLHYLNLAGNSAF